MNYFKLINQSIFTVKLEFSKIYFGKQFVRELLFEFCNVCEQSVLYLFEFALVSSIWSEFAYLQSTYILYGPVSILICCNN